MGENPWQVHSIQAFSYLKCPECTFDTKKEDTFQDHATANHPLSYVLFTQTIKKEHFEDPLTLEITSDKVMPELNENFNSDYIDYCESKLEEFDEEVDYENTEYNEIKQELKMDYEYIDDSAANESAQEGKQILSKSDDDKSHKCAICSKGFSKISHMKDHVAQIHEDKRPYECTECGKKFKLKKHLKKHFSRAHSDKDYVKSAVKQEYKEDQGNFLEGIDNKTSRK